MKKLLLLFCFLLLVFVQVSAQEYYADVVMDVSASGTVFISGTTNHPALSVSRSENFTSKQGKYWIFSVDLNGVFSDFVFSVKLPEGASINYLRAPGPVQIRSENSRVVVSGVGRKERFFLKIQYSIQGKKNGNFSALSLVFLAGIVITIVGSVFFLKRRTSRAAGFNRVALSERQLAIIEIVERHGVVSQKEVEAELGIPKSSVSRNVNALVKRGILKKEQRGLTNVLFLAEAK